MSAFVSPGDRSWISASVSKWPVFLTGAPVLTVWQLKQINLGFYHGHSGKILSGYWYIYLPSPRPPPPIRFSRNTRARATIPIHICETLYTYIHSHTMCHTCFSLRFMPIAGCGHHLVKGDNLVTTLLTSDKILVSVHQVGIWPREWDSVEIQVHYIISEFGTKNWEMLSRNFLEMRLEKNWELLSRKNW